MVKSIHHHLTTSLLFIFVSSQIHAEILARYPGLVAQVAPVMKVLQTCIQTGPPHPEDLTKLLDVCSHY